MCPVSSLQQLVELSKEIGGENSSAAYSTLGLASAACLLLAAAVPGTPTTFADNQ
jgi:hypothetical protein